MSYIHFSADLVCVKFRTLNHRLPIEVGRWRNIIRENRICNLCNGRNLGDEFHYLFECPSLSNERKKYFEPHFINRQIYSSFVI